MSGFEKLPDVWSTRDYPVLLAVGRLTAESTRPITTQQVASEADIELPAVIKAVEVLADRYLLASDISTYDGPNYLVSGLTDDGRREVGQWPSDEAAADRILEAITTLLERDDTPEQTKNWLIKTRDSLAGMGRDVLTQLAGAALRGPLGL